MENRLYSEVEGILCPVVKYVEKIFTLFYSGMANEKEEGDGAFLKIKLF